MEYQKTIAKEISFSGRGLHTGQTITISLKPARDDAGLTFVRNKNGSRQTIKADVASVMNAPRRTTLGTEDFKVHTVEHMLAALTGMEIDNLEIEIDGEEIPEIDGSAMPYVKLIKDAGIKQQSKPRRFLRPSSAVAVSDGEAYLAVLPSDKFKISFTIDYARPGLKSQYASFELNSDNFVKELAPARTFCFEDEIKQLQHQGLGKGANYKNTVVIGSEGIVNGELRFENEFVRHKILDLLGDLTLIGGPLHAEVVAVKSGHSANLKLARELKKVLREEISDAPANEDGVVFDIEQIRKILPHRYPFLLVDRITEIEGDKRITGIKNVTANEEFFNGHFPQRSIMPGVLLVEAMAQTAGVLLLRKQENLGKLAYVVSIDGVKLRRPVVPGDQLRMEAEVYKIKAKTGRVRAKTYVAKQLVAEADFVFSLVEA